MKQNETPGKLFFSLGL